MNRLIKNLIDSLDNGNSEVSGYNRFFQSVKKPLSRGFVDDERLPRYKIQHLVTGSNVIIPVGDTLSSAYFIAEFVGLNTNTNPVFKYDNTYITFDINLSVAQLWCLNINCLETFLSVIEGKRLNSLNEIKDIWRGMVIIN